MRKERKLRFSSWRCVASPSVAQNATLSQGYLMIHVGVHDVRVELEPLSENFFAALKRHWTSSQCHDGLGESLSTLRRIFPRSKAGPCSPLVASIARLLAPFYLIVTVNDTQIVFRSPTLDFRRSLAHIIAKTMPQKPQRSSRGLQKRIRASFSPVRLPLLLRKRSASLLAGRQRPFEEALPVDQTIILERSLGKRVDASTQRVSQGRENEIWDSTFDVYHPDSFIGFHLVFCGDSSLMPLADDEVVSSHYVSVTDELSLLLGEPKTLRFQASLPYTPISIPLAELSTQQEFEKNRGSLLKHVQRVARITFTVSLRRRHASWLWRQWPAYCLDPPRVVRRPPCSGNWNVSLLQSDVLPTSDRASRSYKIFRHNKCSTYESVEICEQKERLMSIRRMLEYCDLLTKIVCFWWAQLRSQLRALRSWDKPLSSVLCLLALLLLVIPGWSLGLLLQYTAILAAFLSCSWPLFNQDPLGQQLTGFKTASSKPSPRVTFQFRNSSQQQEASGATSMECLVTTLLDSAVPPELEAIMFHVQRLLVWVFPRLVRAHALLTGYSAAEVAALYRSASDIQSSSSKPLEMHTTLHCSLNEEQGGFAELVGRRRLAAAKKQDGKPHRSFIRTYYASTIVLFLAGFTALVQPKRFSYLVLIAGALRFTWFLIQDFPFIQSLQRIVKKILRF